MGDWQRDLADIGSEGWLRQRFPDKDWHRHPRTDGRTDMCDGTPSDCRSKVRIELQPFAALDGGES